MWLRCTRDWGILGINLISYQGVLHSEFFKNEINSSILICRGFPGGALKNPPANAGRHKRCEFDPWVRKIPWREGTHSSILAWRIPLTEESGRLQPIGSYRVGHNWSDLAPSKLGKKTRGVNPELYSLNKIPAQWRVTITPMIVTVIVRAVRVHTYTALTTSQAL